MGLEFFKLYFGARLAVGEVLPSSADDLGSAVRKLVLQVLEKIEIAECVGVSGVAVVIFQASHFLNDGITWLVKKSPILAMKFSNTS